MVTYSYNGYPAYYPDEYTDHHDNEWDRSTVLDPLWEYQQKKTFTAWCNSHLRKAGTRIENLEEDFQNGLKLMLLLEVISGEPMPRPDRGKTRFHRIANVNKALDYIRRKGVKLVSLGAESIVDGNQKMILGLIWTLILRFAIQNINVGDLSARDGLLLWCQRKTEPYQNVDVQNFSNSWRDGLAFCALIHRHRPELLDYNSLNPNNPIENLNLAFDIADKHLDIPPMLDANELVELCVWDEKALITYISSFYHKFAIKGQIERAANRVAKELEADRENKNLAGDYDDLASNLLNWTNKWTPWLQNRNEDHSLDDANKKLNDFRQYRLQEKPLKVGEKGDLENLHNKLQTRLKLNNRPLFRPKNGQLIEDINSAFDRLDLSEKGFEEWLLSEIAKMQRLQHLAQKFHQKYNIYKEWSDGKEELLLFDDYKLADSHGLKCLRKKHEFFEAEMAGRQERVEQLVVIAKELGRLRYPNIQLINRLCSEVCDNWQKLADGSEKRREKLDEMERILEKLDDLHLKFATLASPFNNWNESTIEDLQDIVILSDMNEIGQLLSEHNQFKETLPDADNSIKDLLDLDQQIQSLIQHYGLNPSFLHNPYTDLTSTQLNSSWNKVKALVPIRDAELQKEYSRQKNIEQLRQAFIQKSNEIGPWLEKQLETVIGLSSNVEDANKMINQLTSMKSSVTDKKSQITDLENINKQLQDNLIYSIPNSKYTMQSLRVGIEMLLTSINKAISEFENHLLIANSKNQQIDQKQLNDYRQSFQHFNKDQKGLNEEQFRSFLISIGHNSDVKDEKFKDKLQELDANKTGRIDFTAILDYLNNNKDSCTQMCDAFRVLAGGKPQITPEDLRREFPLKQAEQCLIAMDRFFDHSTCQYDYDKFCRRFYST